MTWLRIDDGFEEHSKVEPLSNEAHRLWMRAACWCKKAENIHTNGFVPEAMLETIARRTASKKQLLKLAEELVNSRIGGTKEHGLWEPRPNGWQFHDWATYQPPPEQPETLSRSEAAKVAGKASAEARRKQFGSAQPKPVPNESPNDAPNDSGDVRESFAERRSEETDRASRTTIEPPDPDPVPEEEDPPTPPNGFSEEHAELEGLVSEVRQKTIKDRRQRPRDPMGDHYAGRRPSQRSDVRTLHEAWKKRFGFDGHKLEPGNLAEADILAQAIDARGLDECLLILEFAPQDGMVSGKADEKGEPHESITYIFGNQHAVARILRLAKKAQKPSEETVEERFERLSKESA